MAMTLVSTTTVGSGGAASIEFTNIPQTGKDLLILFSARAESGFENAVTKLEFNSNTSNYSGKTLYNFGGNVFSGSPTTIDRVNTQGNTATANTFGNSYIYVSNYTASANKSISVDAVGENNATNQTNALGAYAWANTSAITSLKIVDAGAVNFTQHTSASLYIIS